MQGGNVCDLVAALPEVVKVNTYGPIIDRARAGGILEAELWGVRSGLRAWDLRHGKVQVDVDSKLVVNWLQGSGIDRRIESRLSLPSRCSFISSGREIWSKSPQEGRRCIFVAYLGGGPLPGLVLL
ncbi:hypothetical protein Ancab_023131 [Ancistrocladus abbreviatus]